MSAAPPDALLFIAPGCPHCPAVLQALGEMVKQATIGRLTVVNVASHPEQAAQLGARGSPWLRLGPFTFTDALSPVELRQWAEQANGEEGVARYIEHLLIQGEYQQAVAFIAEDTQRLKPLLTLIADTEADIDIRLGVSALLEAHTNTPGLQHLLPQLAELTRHADHRVRADACHLLGLTGSAAARAHVAVCLNDEYAEVREIAEEAMEALGKTIAER